MNQPPDSVPMAQQVNVHVAADHPCCLQRLCLESRLRGAPVICHPSGHDGAARDDRGFRRVLANGLAYLAGQADGSGNSHSVVLFPRFDLHQGGGGGVGDDRPVAR